MSLTKERSIFEILKKKTPGTVAFFDKGDYYQCYNQDAIFVANNIFLSDVGLKKILFEMEEVIYLNLNNAQYIKVLKDLLFVLRTRVEVYEEINGKLLLRAQGTLSNLDDFEDIVSDCVELTELSTLMCVRILDSDDSEKNRVSVCFCNSQNMQIIVSEFNDCTHFPFLEQSIVSMNPRECILLFKDAVKSPNRFKQLEKNLERLNLPKLVLEIDIPSNECFLSLNEFFDETYNKFKEELSDNLVQSIYVLVNHMQLLNDKKNQKAFTLMTYSSNGYMYLSNSALQALEIFSLSSDHNSNNVSDSNNEVAVTLYDHLNRCRSQSGRYILREWIRRPLYNLSSIKERLDVVEVLCDVDSVRQILYDDLLRRVPDILFLSRRFVKNKASLQDCYRLYQLIRLLSRIQKIIEELKNEVKEELYSSITKLILKPIVKSCVNFNCFALSFDEKFDISHYELTRQYRIKPEADENLNKIAQKISVLEKKANNLLDKINSELNTDSIKLGSNTDYGFFFRVTLKAEKVVRNAANMGIKVIDTTKGGGVRFTTPDLIKLNQSFCELQFDYEAGLNDQTNELIKLCCNVRDASSTELTLQKLSERLGILDVLTSFAVVATSSPTPYVRPELLEKSTNVFELIECRHPVIEQAPHMQFIPNNIKLSNSKFIILTGANMGGKSTYLRSTALAVLMAQMGCFVACSYAKFSIIDGIFTRVGAGDYQSRGISTFMAEMMDCTTIFETATKNSLIIIDELGRGTSTYDGFGLAWAIAEEIILRVKCFCLFATHFYELSKLKDFHSDIVENYKVETIIDENKKLTILHQIVPGVADCSFGIDIGKLVGLPNNVIEDASTVLKKLQKFRNLF